MSSLFIIFFKSLFFFNNNSVHLLFVGCIAFIKTFAAPPFLYLFMTSNCPLALSINSSCNEVSTVESITIFSGSSEKHTVISISAFPTLLSCMLASAFSNLIVPFPSLKNISNASKIVDLPISFFPTKTVKSLKLISVSLLYPRKFFNLIESIFIAALL